MCVAMKKALAIMLIVWLKVSFAQTSYNDIDWRVRTIEAPAPDSLSKLLVEGYTTDLQKVRAIFGWITQHISYNTFVFGGRRQFSSSKYVSEPEDTSVWKSANEMTALKVLNKRIAVCDGYAKLFKVLCDYAGLQCEVITGYARGFRERGDRFRSNHSWNAVMIDSVWRLLDVTWASGFINYADQFVQQLDENYFLTPPQQFIYDHYPEDLRWTLMDNPPTIGELRRMPYRGKSYSKYSIDSYAPSHGIIEAEMGTTVQIELDIKNLNKDKAIAPDPFFDSSVIDHTPYSVFLSPSDTLGNKIIYRYPVVSSAVTWINVMYNGDMVLRYRLNVIVTVAPSNQVNKCF
jgi:transglutaminase/protease-like cytokinesis protein 3